VAHLHVARGHVVDDRVAEDVVHRPRARDVAAAAADHDRELALVVDLAADRRARQAHRVVRADRRTRELGEDDRPGVLDRQAGAKDALGELGGMGVVVAADAEEAAQRPRQRRAQLDRLDRQARAGGGGSGSPRARASISGRAPRVASATARGVASRPSAAIVPTWRRPPQLQLAIRIALVSVASRGRRG
jgi:hypothetical protein